MAKITGQVAAIMNERELVINRGGEDGVRLDMIFQVMDRAVPIIDPESKKQLGTISREKIKIKIARIEAKFSIARTFETYKVNEGGQLNVNFDSLLSLRPAKVVTKVRTLRFDETGLDYAPLDPSESFVKVGDPIEEAESPSVDFSRRIIGGFDEVLATIPAELSPPSGQWSPTSVIRVNELLNRNVLASTMTLRMVVEAVQRSPDGRYKGIPRLSARFSPSDKLKLSFLVYTYFNNADVATLAKLDAIKQGANTTVRGNVERADLDIHQSMSLNIDLFNCVLLD